MKLDSKIMNDPRHIAAKEELDTLIQHTIEHAECGRGARYLIEVLPHMVRDLERAYQIITRIEAEAIFDKLCFKVVDGINLSDAQFCGDCFKIKLPKGLAVKGDFEWRDFPLSSLPAGLKIHGNMDIFSARNLTALPSDLVVDGNFSACGAGYYLKTFPAGIKVGGDVGLSCSCIDRFEVKEVHGSLDLYRCPIETLPDGLSVGGNLNLGGTLVRELPTALKVGGDLILTGACYLSSLPDDLEVGGDVYLAGTDIEKIPPSIKVGGEILWDELPQ